MTISIWRYSHLALAVSSFLFLILASVTGVILAFKPITEKTQPYAIAGFNEITLAQSLPQLRKVYPEITELSVDANHFVQVKGSDADGEKLLAYADPQTGKILGTPAKENEFFLWVTSLHRSLFLHETGRFFVGLTAFLLSLITLSGVVLVVQRQRGLKRFFTKVVYDNFAQYYHVVLGRWFLIPILIITLSGTYLSLARFGAVNIKKKTAEVDFDQIRSAPAIKAEDFAVFKQVKLAEVESVEFPFSEDAEDYYTLKLKDRELTVNQITGDVLTEVKYPVALILTDLSLDLHTGRASGIWAAVLAIASANILFFIYSGFAIFLKRRVGRTKNKYAAAESKFIILTGSENGSTFRFAQAIHQQLSKAGERSFLTELNNYTVFPKAEYLVIVTSTHGLGDPPTNAAKFKALLEKQVQLQDVRYSVLGFGSKAYPDFCKFAFDVNQMLSHQKWAVPLTDIHTVNDKSPDEFGLWAEDWSQHAGITLNVLPELNGLKAKRLEKLTVQTKVIAPVKDGIFTLGMKAGRRLRVRSGDLLAIYPENDHRERLYSIGVIGKEISLCVRPHPGGIGSGFLQKLEPGEKISAKIIDNKHFHFPEEATEVVLIANGTGIAPFLGMISENVKQVSCHLYCGFRERSSYQMHQVLLEQSINTKKLLAVHTAFSREGNKQYVTDLIARDAHLLAQLLQRGGVLMVCGSLAMQKDVMGQIENVVTSVTGHSLAFYQSHNQIRSDCY